MTTKLNNSSFSFFVCCVLALLTLRNAYAQHGTPPKIAAIGRAEENAIRLRWGPTSHVLWQRANKSGYILDKYILVRDNRLLPKPEKILTQHLQVKPADAWRPIVENKQSERYAAIALQAIYGVRFDVQSTAANNFSSVMTGVQEQEMRFSFAMMSADYSFDVATAMAVGYLDTQVKKGEKYLYKIYMNLPQGSPATVQDTAFVFLGLEDFQKLPAPVDLAVQFGNGTATVSWNTMYHEHIYTGYSIERSEDGRTFKRLSDIPVTRPVRSSETIDSKYIHKTDSLPSNNKTYHYRIVGHTPFGDSGPPSAAVKGQGSETLAVMPMLDAPAITGERVKLSWHFLDEKDKSISLIRGFAVEKSLVGAADNYKAVHTELLDAKTRNYTDKLEQGSFFYRIKIVDKNDREFFSFPQMVKAIDSIPPTVPAKIFGEVDSLGNVTLNWENVPDKDLLGYKVFRSNHKNAEFSLATGSPIPENMFRDEVEIKTLSSEIYYKVVAVDQSFNHSNFSEVVTIVKPDVLPPVSPVLRVVEYDDNRVKLTWINSSSNDVQSHHVYRRANDSPDWVLLEAVSIEDSIQTFWDEAIESGIRYSYSVLAVDKSALESSPSNSMSVLVPRRSPKPTGLIHEVNEKMQQVTLRWDKSDAVKYYWIYRSTNDGTLAYYRKIEAVNSFTDKIDPANQYKYRLKAFFKKDLPATFSDEIVVNVK